LSQSAAERLARSRMNRSTDIRYLQKFRPFRGNNLLKREGEDIEFTQTQLEEYIKCSDDPEYFIENYVKIIHPDRGLVKFELRDYQRKIVQSVVNNRFTIVATARQVGKSTTIIAILLWYVLFHREKVVALLANKGDTARLTMSKFHVAYQNLPKWMQQGVKEWNKGSVYLENECRIIAAATSSSAIRGFTINFLFLDECAHIMGKQWEEFELATLPTVSESKESKIVQVSTPRGLNHFYKYWKDAEKGLNGYNPIKVNWNEVPGRDEQWYKEILGSMGNNTDKFSQEYGVEFLGSSNTLIAGWKLKELAHDTPIHSKMGLSQYKIPDPECTYMMTVDTSHGKGLDYSAFQVVNCSRMPYEIVCSYRSNNVTPNDFADLIHKTALIYNSAAILVETNDIGYNICSLLINDFEYDNMLYTISNAGRGGKRITTMAGPGVDTGLKQTIHSKKIGCTILKLLIESNQLIVPDFHTIEELATFSKHLESYKAEEGCHDDMVMCLVMFAWLSSQETFKEISNVNTLKVISDHPEEQLKEDLIPFGFVEDNNDKETIEEKSYRFYNSFLFPEAEDDPPVIDLVVDPWHF
jgi:hypothetical protein